VDAFEVLIKSYLKIGINEFIFYYPVKEEQMQVFKEIAEIIIP
jgi:hypothetical protein